MGRDDDVRRRSTADRPRRAARCDATSRIGPAESPVPGRGDERRLVEDVAPADVDQPGIRSDGVEDRLTHGVSRGGRQRRRDEHVVGPTHDLADLIEADDLLGNHAIGIAGPGTRNPRSSRTAGLALTARTRTPNASARRATSRPIEPYPTIASVRPRNPWPAERHPRRGPRAQVAGSRGGRRPAVTGEGARRGRTRRSRSRFRRSRS